MSLALKALLVFSVLVATKCQEADGEEEDSPPTDNPLTVVQLRGLHAKFDANGDGKASFPEVMAFSEGVTKAIAGGRDVGDILEEVDTNKDGTVSLEEHMNDIRKQVDAGDDEEKRELEHRKGIEKAKFNAADADGNGHLDKSELPALYYPESHDGVLTVMVQESMRQLDKNKDGKLSATEFWASDLDDDHDADLQKEQKVDFEKLDKNGDGSLDLEELRAWESGKFQTEGAMNKLFEVADKDRDMHVTGDELAEAKDMIADSDAHYHLVEWAMHHEL